jgi:hypothetical protein
MAQNGNPGPRANRPRPRAILAIILIFLALVIGIGSVIAYFVLTDTQRNNPTPTATTGVGNGSGEPCNQNSPYGFTTIHADTQLVSIYKQLNVCWVRYQVHWWDKNKKGGIEATQGVRDWTQVDAAVATMNKAGIHIDFPIQQAPPWDMTQQCNGTPFLPGPAQMRDFATEIATRYDGHHGHGYIDAFEIGNEEYDNYYDPGNGSASLQCRSASYYGPVLQAGYEAIKAASPNALVGMFGMWYHNLPHIQDFMTYLYSNGYGKYMDYMNFHYYNDSGDPAVSEGERPSFDVWWQAMHGIATKYGFANKPIWITETGWPDQDPQAQDQHLQYVMSQASNSHVIQKVFWFTVNYGNQSKNIYPPGGPLPAFTTFQKIVQQKPQWG